MSGASVGCSQPAPCPGMTPLKRCRNRGEKGNIVFIDVDNDVIFIDVPESSERNFRASNVMREERRRPCPRTGVICLDDDENTDENFANGGARNGANFLNGASSSMRVHSNSGGLGKSSDTVGDECQFIRENVCPMKLSKCKRTYSGNTSARNQYGISTDSGSCPSDSDHADCELMEDSFGRVRAQWEKASSRRKCDTRNVQSGTGDPDSIFNVAGQNVDGANDCSQQRESLFERNGEDGEAPPHFVSKENANVDFNYNYGKQTSNKDNDDGSESILRRTFPPDKDDPLYRMNPFAKNVNVDLTCNEDDDGGLGSILRRHVPPDKNDPLCRMNPFAKGPSGDCAERLSGQQFERGGSSAYREEQGPKVPYSFIPQEHNSSRVNHVGKDFQIRQRSPPGESCLSRKKLYAGKATSEDSASSVHVDARSTSADRDKVYQETTSTSNQHFQWNSYQKFSTAKEKFASEQASSLKSGSSGERIDDGSSPDNGKDELVPGSTSRHKSSLSGVDAIDGKVCHPDNFERGHSNPLGSNSYDAQTGDAVKSMGDNQQEDQREDVMLDEMAEDCIVSEREKLKETEEYKRALEEEMASRQQALQIQAEEAQRLRRLRKKLKAESMRLLDMERRQKQRVEEIRETQKKDEENMNLKEGIRAQVIKELHQLEVRCHDMASLLRGLGTFISDSVNPSPNEVRAAYKRALLTFHPDRSSRSDIRQQVEAEEKFKLISRMKEKFSWI